MSLALQASRKPEPGKVRLLHVVESLHTGAVENWLLRMFVAASNNSTRYHWTFFCALGRPGRLDERVRRLGGEVVYSPVQIGETRLFFNTLRKFISDGDFDVLHCHHDLVSAVYLLAALGLPLRRRIVHVHNIDEAIPTANPVKQFLFKEPMRQTCIHLADNVVGISQEALSQFTRRATPKTGRDRVIHYGVDTAKFRDATVSREEFRTTLGFPPDAKVLLFAGRMVEVKNPLFVVEILAQLRKTEPRAVALFVGSGQLTEKVIELANQRNVTDQVKVLGWRDDGAAIMRLSDLLIFPRWETPKEGLGLVLVEAQAAGLPILASPSVTEDVKVIPELFEFLPLASAPAAWAAMADRMLQREFLSPAQALEKIEASSFSLEAGLASLLSLYPTT